MSYPALRSIDPLIPLLPLKSVVVTLELLDTMEIGMLHHVPLNGWLRNLLGSPENFAKALIIDPLENSHHRFTVGNLYKFRIIITAQGDQLLNAMVQKLQQLPHAAKHIDNSFILHHNVKLHAIHDGFSDKKFHTVKELLPFGLKAITDHVALIKQSNNFTLRFLTPAILLKDSKQPKQANALKYCRDKNDINWSGLTKRISDTFINLIASHTEQRYQRPQWPNGEAHADVTIWMEYRYRQQQKKRIGGVLTTVACTTALPLTQWQWAMLIIGQYLGIGQSRGFGFGIYQIEYSATFKRPKGAASVLRAAFAYGNLDTSLQHNINKHGQHGKDDAAWMDQLSDSAYQIQQHTYQPPALIPHEIAKSDGGKRKLSIPPWEDRVLQRAVGQILSSAFDSHWMQYSYGYRTGHSRHNARDQINTLIQQGYEWILEADIKGFFDNVGWDNLHKRLLLLFPADEVVDALLNWIKAPLINEDGTLQQRNNGLPQGSPISPVLANFILDDFDADMQAHNYQIVRFADDFVLLFKTEQQAKTALTHVHASLIEHQLELNLLKTRIIHKQKGFKFLGFFFIDGYAIQTKTVEQLTNCYLSYQQQSNC